MEIKEINKKIVSAFLTLTFRRAILYVIVFATTNLYLARLLSPSIIGIFNIGNSVLAFFAFFSDIGLAAALIQKKEITDDDLKTTFTIQQILAASITIIVWVLAPFFVSYYQLTAEAVWLVRALAVSFFLTSLKVLPSVIFERVLRFKPLVLVEVGETIVFCISLIILSLNNFGLHSYSWSVLLRGITGVFLIYILSPWRISVGISKVSVKGLLTFGIPFQINSILALFKDRLIALVVARIIGSVGVGYITWAQSWAFMSLEVMNIMTRITFPAFSRLQGDPKALKDTLEKSIFFTAFFMYPILFGLLAVAPSLVKYVVLSKWEPAIPLIYLFSITAFWATLSTPFTNFLNSIGKINITLKLMIMWTVLEWVITPFLTLYYGFIGVAISSAIISFSSIIPMFIIKRLTGVQIITNIWQPFFAASIMATLAFIMNMYFVRDEVSLFIVIVLSGIIYLALIGLIAYKKVIENYRGLFYVAS